MAHIEKSALLEYSAAEMFALVDAVERYPEFLPWCGGASIERRDARVVQATLLIDYHHIRQSFTTENTREPPREILIRLVRGPFRTLIGHWRFTPLGDNACKVALTLDFEFSGRLLDKAVGRVFHYIASTLVEAFTQRARQVYGDSHGRG